MIDQHLIEIEMSRLAEGITDRRVSLESSAGVEAESIREQIGQWNRDLVSLQNIDEYGERACAPTPGDSDLNRVDIIVLKYNQVVLESDCLDRINHHTDHPYRLIYFDNRNYGHPTTNFAKIWNRLVHESSCDYICIADSDAYVSEKWLSRMMSSFKPGFSCLSKSRKDSLVAPEKVGLVVPVTHPGGAHTIQGMHRNDLGKPFITRSQVSGFFFLFKKEMFYDIGPFDERFNLHGQDSEWVDRILASGWQIVVRTDVMVGHTVSASIGKAETDGEVDLAKERQYTQLVYDTIRKEKAEGYYKPCVGKPLPPPQECSRDDGCGVQVVPTPQPLRWGPIA